MPTPKHSPLPWEPCDPYAIRADNGNGEVMVRSIYTEDRDLILASVNAMHPLNPSNPMAAAEAVVEVVRAFECLLTIVEQSTKGDGWTNIDGANLLREYMRRAVEDRKTALAALRKEA